MSHTYVTCVPRDKIWGIMKEDGETYGQVSLCLRSGVEGDPSQISITVKVGQIDLTGVSNQDWQFGPDGFQDFFSCILPIPGERQAMLQRYDGYRYKNNFIRVPQAVVISQVEPESQPGLKQAFFRKKKKRAKKDESKWVGSSQVDTETYMWKH